MFGGLKADSYYIDESENIMKKVKVWVNELGSDEKSDIVESLVCLGYEADSEELYNCSSVTAFYTDRDGDIMSSNPSEDEFNDGDGWGEKEIFIKDLLDYSRKIKITASLIAPPAPSAVPPPAPPHMNCRSNIVVTPRMTTAQRDAIAASRTPLIYGKSATYGTNPYDPSELRDRPSPPPAPVDPRDARIEQLSGVISRLSIDNTALNQRLIQVVIERDALAAKFDKVGKNNTVYSSKKLYRV